MSFNQIQQISNIQTAFFFQTIYIVFLISLVLAKNDLCKKMLFLKKLSFIQLSLFYLTF